MPHVLLSIAVAVLGLMSLIASPVLAVGTEDGGGEAASVSGYAEAKGLVDAGNYVAALPGLRGLTKSDPKNADAWNLLGFTYRNLGEMAESSAAYLKVLTINPDHLGALEYQGELFLETGRPDLARANFERLKQLCGSCDEADDLEKALLAAGV